MKRCFSFFWIVLLSLPVLCQTSRSPTAISQIVLEDRFNRLPIKPERTVSFTADEASYMDVDLSPDDNTILFSFLGDIFSVPASGGAATQLTRGLAINRCPVWSPDGKLIAYESDATGFIRLHVTDIAGSFHKVFGEDRPQKENLKPVWFPDSKQVVVERDIYHLTGVESSFKEGITSILGFSFDGRYSYYTKNENDDSIVVFQADRTSGDEKQWLILNKRKANFANIKVSPNGRWLTYIKQKSYYDLDSLMAIDLVSGKERLLTNLNVKFGADIGDRHYSFSKDSKYLFIGYGGKIHRIDIETGDNEIIPFTANVTIDLGKLNYNTFNVSLDSFNVKYIRSVQRSPDGKLLVFSALNKVYRMKLPSGKPQILVDQPVNQFQPAYSPDGKWIAYVSWSDKEGGHIWRVPSQGGKPEQITTIAGLYQHPSWSPDGKSIVVAKGANKLGVLWDPGFGRIQIISIKDKRVKVIADTVPLFNQPMFSSDAKQVYYKPKLRGKLKYWPSLVAKDTSNNEIKVLANAKENTFIPIRQIVLSPDNRYLVFMYNEDLYLRPVANVESAPIIFDEKTPTTVIRFARGCIDPVWEEGGKVLSWTDVNRYCRIDPDKLIEAAEHLDFKTALSGLPNTRIIDVDIPADETIAINLKTPRLYNKEVIALKNVRIITMNGKEVIEDGTIVIKEGRFISVGNVQEIAIPKEATVYDLKGKTVIPGLIDMHSHMYDAVPPDVFLQQSWARLLNLSYGVTTIRDPSGSYDTFGYSELIETGKMAGPRLFTVGHAVRPHYSLNSLDEAKIIVNNRAKMNATGLKQYTQPTRLQRQLLLLACEQEGVNMTNEVEQNPLYCLGMIKDGSTGVEHNPIWGDAYKDVITFVAKSGTYLTPTLQLCYARKAGRGYFRKIYGQGFFNNYKKIIPEVFKKDLLAEINEEKLDSGFLDQAKIDAAIKNAEGKVVLGSHGEDQGIGVHYELWALQMGGLTNMEALQTATISAAVSLGMQKDLGSIEVGKIADLIILNKNPLEDIHNSASIQYVVKAGIVYDQHSLERLRKQ